MTRWPCVQVLAALDGLPLTKSRKVLATGCGRCENTGMEFAKDRRTVGRKWGGPPVLIEALDMGLALPGPRKWFALKPDGTAGTEHKTMWYLRSLQ